MKQTLRWINTPEELPAIFHKGDNFCDFPLPIPFWKGKYALRKEFEKGSTL